MKYISHMVNDRELLICFDKGNLYIKPITEAVIRCVYTQNAHIEKPSLLFQQYDFLSAKFRILENNERIVLLTEKVLLDVKKSDGTVLWKKPGTEYVYLYESGKELQKADIIRFTTGNEEPVIERVQTADGERNFVRNLKPEKIREAYRGRLNFTFEEDEGIFGLGQGEEGIYNYRGHTQYLYQHNGRIPMPVFLSSRGYGIMFDCSSLMTFNDDERGTYMFFDTVDQLDYYFMPGESYDEIVDAIRTLTGRSAMLPRWSFGYIQSKERYTTADELVDVAEHYRNINVPLDCIVQDWNTWKPGFWGEKTLDTKRYGNMRECADKLKHMHVHTMVSVWPNMNSNTEDYSQFAERGYLLKDYSTYDAFAPKARDLYWKQMKEGLFDQGFDSWWCDSTEPFSGVDWNGSMQREPWERYHLVGEEHKKYIDADKANIYAILHAKGIYENQRNYTQDKRVLNLTRSGYLSGSQYGAVLWSGDICARWDVLEKQIIEGLNMGLSGYPYWTLDIGGFFTVREKWENRGCGCNQDPSEKWFWKGDYDEGVHDKGYCELYTRWLQMACFLPMFRSHGTDTPREIWNFGGKGTAFYDAIEKFIKLRYHLMPYIYSLAGAVWRNNATIMRSLLFDFMNDKKAHGISNEFMFGPNLLVCPVTKPMYYLSGNRCIEAPKRWKCYLPSGADWYDFWTNKYYKGGQEIEADASIDKIPVFVKAGSVLPLSNDMQYADDNYDSNIFIRVYSGADGSFTLYQDEGDNYNYEKEIYKATTFYWNDAKQKLLIVKTEGKYQGEKPEVIYEPEVIRHK